jgi:hypothetical protein
MVALLIDAVATYQVGGSKYDAADQATRDGAQQFANRVTVSDYAASNVAAVDTSDTSTYATTLAFGTGGLTVTEQVNTVITARTAVDTAATAQAALISTANPTAAQVAAKLIADALLVSEAAEAQDP